MRLPPALVLTPVLLLCAAPRAEAAATPVPGESIAGFDVIGTIGVPVIAVGMYQLGHLIDEKRQATDETIPQVYDKLFFVAGVGIDYVGLQLLADGLKVPATWASTAAGVGLGLGVFGAFIGIDAAVMAGLNLRESDTGTGVLALMTLASWSVMTAVFVSTDPFHLAHGTTTETRSTSASLLALTF